MSDVNRKNKTVAGLLALFLGGIGIHRFYLGKNLSGIFYFLFCWTLIPALIGLAEAIIILIGSEASFVAKYPGLPWSSSEAAIAPDAPSPDTHVKCPDCRELVLSDARVCKHCRCKLIPVA
jgi:TM2 domain-containing membrane protein YozV